MSPLDLKSLRWRNQELQLENAVNRIQESLGVNVLDFKADPTGSKSSSEAINNAIDEVSRIGTNRSAVLFPYGTYSIDSTINWKTRVHLIGGDENFATSNPSPEIRWDGPAGGTMFQTDLPGTSPNHRGWMDHLRINGNNLADDLIDVRSRIDWSGGFREVQLIDSRRHGIVLRQGAINFSFVGGRADDVGGFVFAVLDDGAGFNGTVSNFVCRDATFDWATTGSSGAGQGLLFLDYESIAASPYFFGLFEGCHLELNGQLEDWVSGEGNRASAIMAIGHNNNYTENGGRVNAQIQWSNMRVAVGAADNYAIAKLSKTADFLLFTWSNCNFGRNGKTVSVVDNTTTPGPDISAENLWLHLSGSFGPHGQGGIGNIRRDFHIGEVFINGLHLPEFTTANLPTNSADNDGLLVIEDDATNGRNLIYYTNGQKFRVGGTAF